jgi:hypothetical protein
MVGIDKIADAYFNDLILSSIQALQTSGEIEHKLLIGGQTLAMRFAGAGLEQALMPALRHLVFDFLGDPELTLYLWDSASTGITLPNLPWDIPSGELWRFQTEQVAVIHLPGLKNILWMDRRAKTAIFWMEDLADIRIVDRGSPLLHLWAWWLPAYGIQLTHAAALSGKNGAALLLGKGGSGKSTTALSSLNSSLQYLGDDYCLISAAPSPQVFSLYSSGKVNAVDRYKFPWLESAFAGNDQEKALFHLHPVFTDQIVSQEPLQALISSRITGKAETTIEKITPIQVMRAIAPSTIFQLHMLINPSNALHLMAEVAKKVPGYQLNLGTEREQILPMLIKLLGD